MLIRSYSKAELSELYNPDLDPQYAQKVFNRWLTLSPGLLQALQLTGYTRCQRHLTPRQVQLIVEALGEP